MISDCTGGAAPVIVNSAGDGVELNLFSTGNTLRGFNVGNCSGSALYGSSFGTLTLAGDVSINSTGLAIGLMNGTISGNFGSVVSSGGLNNVFFSVFFFG